MGIKKTTYGRSKRDVNRGCEEHPIEFMFDEYKEPETWTIISALDRVQSLAEDSKLSEEFWKSCERPLAFLVAELRLTGIQVVVLSILVETGETLSWKRIANYLDCSRLSVMTYSEEIDGLVAKRWVMRKECEFQRGIKGFALVPGVVTALRHNKPFVPERLEGLDIQQFVDKLEKHVNWGYRRRGIEFSDEEEWMMLLVEANPQLPLCQKLMKMNDIHERSLLLMIIYDYAQWADSEQEGLGFNIIDDIYPEDWDCGDMRQQLTEGTHCLIEGGLVEYKYEDGIADSRRFALTSKAKADLLAGYVPSRSRCKDTLVDSSLVKSHSSIHEKKMFYNADDQEQILQLTKLLGQDSLPAIQQRLEEQGLRKGFACLFYGAPGTGKTETVLQIARQTGRDLMQVDIAGLRDKFVGESEKNIKEVFRRYRKMCERSEVMPILFFNEADAIFNQRLEEAKRSVDLMNNAIQNIILQEVEELDGILIATTNLTNNLDSAFERRFLFKVEFHRPTTEVKTKIWTAMLGDISEEDAHYLAVQFDFAGGQIENIARKRSIDYILSGKTASLEDLEAYCKAEALGGKKELKRVAGFA